MIFYSKRLGAWAKTGKGCLGQSRFIPLFPRSEWLLLTELRQSWQADCDPQQIFAFTITSLLPKYM